MTTTVTKPKIRQFDVAYHAPRDLAERVQRTFDRGEVAELMFGNLVFRFDDVESATQFVEAINESHSNGVQAITLTGFRAVGTESE